ncbi:MAG TPA: RDD family protein [Candidatus Dormibacteraeota bacterium]|nr:RDD family protein [Candidatus Dormibacteraeota bacterium]
MYCSKCGAMIADGAVFCSVCGQAFSAARTARPSMSSPAVAAVPRVEYGGFWLRFLAYLIDSAVMGIGVFLVAIPLIFLTGLGAFLSEIRPGEELSDAGFWLIMGVIFLFATVSLAVTWLYHALMESSEWQATVGKKALGLVVTDLAGCRVSFWLATGRHFAKIVTNMVPLFIGYILAGFTKKKQALHDMIAGCLILRRSN